MRRQITPFRSPLLLALVAALLMAGCGQAPAAPVKPTSPAATSAPAAPAAPATSAPQPAAAPTDAPAARVPPQEGLKEINGTSLYYKLLGQGEPLFVLHGGPGTSHRYFLPHLEALADQYQLVLYDQRGTGMSDGELGLNDLNIVQFVEDLEALRIALGFENISLLGHSWGAALAMYYAATHQEHLNRIILVAPGSVNAKGFREERIAFEQRLTPEVREMLAKACERAETERTPETLAECWKVADRITFHDPSKTSALDYTVEENTAKNYSIVSDKLSAIVRGDVQLESMVQTISVPVLIIHGGHDTFPVSASEHIHQLVPSSELVIISESGHFPFVEQPDTFFAAVREFLAS